MQMFGRWHKLKHLWLNGPNFVLKFKNERACKSFFLSFFFFLNPQLLHCGKLLLTSQGKIGFFSFKVYRKKKLKKIKDFTV